MSTQATENEKNQDTPASAGSNGIGWSFENLSTVAKSTKSKKSKLIKSKKSDLPKVNFTKVNSRTDFLTFETKKAFIYLWKAFTKAPILRHFYLEYHIRIKIDTLKYAISGVLSQMTSDQYSSGHMTHKNLNSDFPKSEIDQWYLIAFFFQKMIPFETGYQTHNQKLLAIVEIFKTCRHYLEGCKYKVLVLTDNNNLNQFIVSKSLSSRQVR